MSGGTLPPYGCSSASCDSGPDRLDELQLEERRRPDDLLRAADVGDARELHENLIAGLTVARDVRLGDAQLVDAAVDRLERLDDGLLAHVLRDVRLHREVVGAGDAGLRS